MRAYGIVDSGDAAAMGPGAMTDQRWNAFFAAASAEGIYPKTLDWRRAYSLQFIQPPGAQRK
jgi:NitT/TauT family transport system substrate-binding protein